MDFINDLEDGYSTLRLKMPKRSKDASIEPFGKSGNSFYKYVVPIATPLLLSPTIASAASPFDTLHQEFLKLADVFALAIISFSGASWMFGHRSKGLELLICGIVGYMIIRYSADIRDYLKLWSEGGL